MVNGATSEERIQVLEARIERLERQVTSQKASIDAALVAIKLAAQLGVVAAAGTLATTIEAKEKAGEDVGRYLDDIWRWLEVAAEDGN